MERNYPWGIQQIMVRGNQGQCDQFHSQNGEIDVWPYQKSMPIINKRGEEGSVKINVVLWKQLEEITVYFMKLHKCHKRLKKRWHKLVFITKRQTGSQWYVLQSNVQQRKDDWLGGQSIHRKMWATSKTNCKDLYTKQKQCNKATGGNYGFKSAANVTDKNIIS